MKFNDVKNIIPRNLYEQYGITLTHLEAVILVETGGEFFTTNDDDIVRPLMRYEGHYFDRLCPANVRERARSQGVSSPKVGGIKNPKSQSDRYRLLNKAIKIDKETAYKSCSFGIGQVMGSHYKVLGFDSAYEFYLYNKENPVNQIDVMLKFINYFGLMSKLRNEDWSGFARGYNGAGYAKNQYHIKLQKAYEQLTQRKSSNINSGYLRLGSTGAGVRELQRTLVLAGYSLKVDGDFGAATDKAVKDFQRRNQLKVDGIVGSQTQTTLTAIKETGNVSEKLTDNKDVRTGATTTVAVPAVIETAKQSLNDIINNVSQYPYLSGTVKYIEIGLTILMIVGMGYGIYKIVAGIIESKKTYTGTKSNLTEEGLPDD